ncbi:MAG: hypothetical protein JRI68_04775 [Deltaproteobacteria bacterium]|nr:hypothetical protein [Deltaproteobacteria bacterium]
MRTRFILVFVLFVCWLVAPAALAQPAGADPSGPTDPAGETSGEPSTPADQPDPAIREKSAYQRRLDNGVKLYREGNYPAAIAEFQEAYRSEPKASPLINLALSYKKLFRYAKAIEVLEQALAKHTDTMKPEHREAAEREVRELNALLAWVTVTLSPPTAQLFIDNEAVPAAKLSTPIALSPGSHQFRAEADGHKRVEVSRTVTSGMNNAVIALTLVPTTGALTVTTDEAEAWIEVDGQMRSQGSWKGALPPGVHSVRVLHEGDVHAIQVVIQEGGHSSVSQDEDGALLSKAAAPVENDGKKGFGLDVPDILRGFYGLGSGAMLTSIVKIEEFTAHDQKRWGAAGGLHLGYRVADWAAFEGMGQFSDIRVEGTMHPDTEREVDTTYKLQTWRFAGMMRVMFPGRTMFRFVATVGAGLVIEEISWTKREAILDAEQNTDARFEDTGGVGPFAEIDVGAELEVSNVLIDVMVQNSIQSSKHLDQGDGDLNAFGGNTQLVIGPTIRIGYGLW